MAVQFKLSPSQILIVRSWLALQSIFLIYEKFIQLISFVWPFKIALHYFWFKSHYLIVLSLLAIYINIKTWKDNIIGYSLTNIIYNISMTIKTYIIFEFLLYIPHS